MYIVMTLKWDTGERLKDNQSKVWPQEDHRQVSKQKLKVQIHKWLYERQWDAQSLLLWKTHENFEEDNRYKLLRVLEPVVKHPWFKTEKSKITTLLLYIDHT